jgi:hypothetical protein
VIGDSPSARTRVHDMNASARQRPFHDSRDLVGTVVARASIFESGFARFWSHGLVSSCSWLLRFVILFPSDWFRNICLRMQSVCLLCRFKIELNCGLCENSSFLLLALYHERVFLVYP